MQRPAVLIVAGFDQSGGAGILADVKTMERHGVYAYAACTGFTFQNERRIHSIHWFNEEEIYRQIDLCFESSFFDWVKIGIGQSPVKLQRVISHLLQHHPGIKIVLDPVIQSSGGTPFWEGINTLAFEWLLQHAFVVTPNWNEILDLYPGKDIMNECKRLSAYGNIFLKGGHNDRDPGVDYLWFNEEMIRLIPETTRVFPKHGSGCVLSSALVSNLALGFSLPEAATRAKQYIEQFLNSNSTLLGWHQL